MKSNQNERERLLQALEHLEREQQTLDVRDDAALRAMTEKLDALRQRIREYRTRGETGSQ